MDKQNIPSDWKIVNGSDCIILKVGSRPRGGASSNGEIPSLGGEHIDRTLGVVDFEKNPKYISREYYNKIKQGHLKENDILINKDGAWTGKLAHVNKLFAKEIAINEHLFIIRNRGDFIQNFLFYYLFSFVGQKQIKLSITGAAQPGINTKFTKLLNIPCPPIEEQQKIATILSNVDVQIRLTVSIIDKSEELKEGMMQKLFTKGIGHNNFKQTLLGEIPIEWEIYKLPDVLKIIDYRGRTPPFSDEGIPYIGADNIDNYRIIFNKRRYVTEETYSKYMTRGIPRRGDILLTTEAPMGKVAIVPDFKFCFAQRVVAFQTRDGSDARFFMYLLKTKNIQKQFINWATGTTVLGISSKNMKFIKLYKPKSDSEQSKISDIITSIDLFIDKEKNRLSSLKSLKKGLMQNLLTGRVRVNV